MSAASSRWCDDDADSSHASRLPRTYAWLFGSSPTRIVPSPGVTPTVDERVDPLLEPFDRQLEERLPVQQLCGHVVRPSPRMRRHETHVLSCMTCVSEPSIAR